MGLPNSSPGWSQHGLAVDGKNATKVYIYTVSDKCPFISCDIHVKTHDILIEYVLKGPFGLFIQIQ